MISLQMLLAGFKDKWPLYAGIAGGVVLLIIFIVGMTKGVMRVRKGGFCLAVAGVGFIALYKFVPNPLAKVLTKGFAGKNCQLIWAVILLLAVVLVTLIIRGALAALFAPEDEKSAVATTTKSIDGVEFEMEEAVEENYSRRKTRYDVARETSPGILARLLGGLLSVLNFVIVIAIIAGVALFVVDVLNVKGGVDGFIGGSVAKLLNKYILPYVLDFITVAIIFGIGCHGFYAGTVGFTRTLLVKIGTILVIIFGLAAPFIDKVNDIKIIDGMITRCANLYAKAPKVAKINGLLGQITTGVLLAIIGSLIMLVINILLKLLIGVIEDTVILRILDGALATIIYLALALALCAILWSALYLLDGAGIFKVQGILTEKSFSMECFETAGKYLSKVVDKYLLKFAG